MLREFAAGGAGLGDEVLRKIAGVFQIVGRILEEGRELGVFRDVDPVVTHMTIAGSLLVLVSATPIRARLRDMQGVPSRPFAKRTPEDLADSVYRLVSEGLRVPQRRGKSSKITSVARQRSRRP